MKKLRKMSKALTIFGVCVVLIVVAGITYYLVVQLPAKQLAETELAKFELLNQEIQVKEEKLDLCLEEARSKYKERWNSACERLGRKSDDGDNCGLPSEQAKHYDSEYKNLRNECLARYK